MRLIGTGHLIEYDFATILQTESSQPASSLVPGSVCQNRCFDINRTYIILLVAPQRVL